MTLETVRTVAADLLGRDLTINERNTIARDAGDRFEPVDPREVIANIVATEVADLAEEAGGNWTFAYDEAHDEAFEAAGEAFGA